MKTNEQTQNEQSHVKESLILKGIASNLLSMQFPKFKNLIDMLQCFDYEVKIEPKIFESGNVVVAFFQKHHNTLSTMIGYENDIACRANSCDAKSTVYSGFLKKIVLCENTISLYMNNSTDFIAYEKQLIDFDGNDKRYMRLIDFFSERSNVFAPNLPIFKHEDKTYSIDEQSFKSEGDLMEFYIQNKEKVFIYQIKIFNDNSITLRCKFEKK